MRAFLWAIALSVFVIPIHADQVAWKNIVKEPSKLENFLINMPKGGDLHLHASGAINTENLIQMAINHHYCVHPDLSLSEAGQDCVDAQLYFSDPLHQKQALNAWSMQNFVSSDPSQRAQHFFSSFPKIDKMMKAHWPEVIARILEQAEREHILYLEIMLSMQGNKPKAIGHDDIKREEVKRFIQANIQQFQTLKSEAKKLTDARVKPDFNIILEIKRNQPFAQFKLDAFEVFAIANAVPEILGINLVQPEYAPYAYQDYAKQMQWLKHLKVLFPNKPLVLHAGEIPLALSAAKSPGHIALAIQDAQPLRIGHGVSILNEPYANQTMDLMRKRGVAVEINLTSNDQILGISGHQHPLRTYLRHHVPVVISSDDPGVSRNHLSHEYVRAVTEQNLSLAEVVMVNRNSIHYSLLPGASLWQDIERVTPIKICRPLNSQDCIKFIATQPKARMEWQLEQAMQRYLSHQLG